MRRRYEKRGPKRYIPETEKQKYCFYSMHFRKQEAEENFFRSHNATEERMLALYIIYVQDHKDVEAAVNTRSRWGFVEKKFEARTRMRSPMQECTFSSRLSSAVGKVHNAVRECIADALTTTRNQRKQETLISFALVEYRHE